MSAEEPRGSTPHAGAIWLAFLAAIAVYVLSFGPAMSFVRHRSRIRPVGREIVLFYTPLIYLMGTPLGKPLIWYISIWRVLWP